MNELIQITTGRQGQPVVSARELYAFLRFDASQWSRWSTKNIVGNRLAKKGDDWEELDIVSKTPEVGRPTTDYALTLDFAKRLSMLARTEKGEEVRRYFITKEDELRQLATPAALSATDPVLLQLISQQAQLLLNQQALLDQLRAEVKQIQQTGYRSPKSRSGQQLTVPGLPDRRRPTGLRSQINQRVDTYCNRYGYDRRETWTYLYKRLYILYGVHVHQLLRRPGESLLDALERYGHLERLHKIVREELSAADE